MKKTSFVTVVGLVSCLLFTACGETEVDDTKAYIASLEAENASLKLDKTINEMNIKAFKEELSSKNDCIAELEAVVSAISASDDNFNYDDETYSSIEELVVEYRSGVWDGEQLHRKRETNLVAMVEPNTGQIVMYDNDDRHRYRTDAYPDLPDGKTPRSYIDCRYQEGIFTCLENDGAHRYQYGEEISFWPIDGITEDSKFFRLNRHPKSIVVGNKIIEYSDDGAFSVLAEGVIYHERYDSGGIDVVSLHDGVLQFWCNNRDDDLIFVVADGVTNAVCLRYANYIVFTKDDGYTYITDIFGALDDNNTDAIPLYQFQLGQEKAEYYVTEYQKMEEDFFNELDLSRQGALSTPFERLLNKYYNEATEG